MPDKRFDTTPKKKTTQVIQHVRVMNGKTISVKAHTRTFIQKQIGKEREGILYNALSDVGVNEIIAADRPVRGPDESFRVLTDGYETTGGEVYYFKDSEAARQFAVELLYEELWDLSGEAITIDALEEVGAGYGQLEDFKTRDLDTEDCRELATNIVDHYGFEAIYNGDSRIYIDANISGKDSLTRLSDNSFIWYGGA